MVERLDGTTQSRELGCQVGHTAGWPQSLHSVEHGASGSVQTSDGGRVGLLSFSHDKEDRLAG